MVTGMEKPYVVGMDIGGTNTVFGVVDSRGNVLATDSVKTQSYSKIEDYVEAVCTKLRPLIESFGGVEKIKGMGVGAPNGNYYNLAPLNLLPICLGEVLYLWLLCLKKNRCSHSPDQ